MSNTIHALYPYLCVKNVDDALAFYKKAFGAKEHFRLTEPNGQVGHAEVYIGPTILMLAEEYPDIGVTAPAPGQPAPTTLHLHVDNADAMINDAIAAGAVEEQTIQDQFYGERSGSIRDPFGYRWLIGHSIEDVSIEEMQNRHKKLFDAE